MLIQIEQALTKDEVSQIRARIDAADWQDGRDTAGAQAALTKRNRQLPEESPAARECADLILSRLMTNPLFISAALPAEIMRPFFNAYEGGESFGAHIDNAIRVIGQTGRRIRTDLSCTLFLSEPDDYDGGELVVEDTYGPRSVKLPAGDMILYPATSLHEVTPVTHGARVGAFFWIQSMIRHDAQRAILFDMDQAIQGLSAELGADHDKIVRLTGIYHNLIRQWATP